MKLGFIERKLDTTYLRSKLKTPPPKRRGVIYKVRFYRTQARYDSFAKQIENPSAEAEGCNL